jgi:alkanesulfonate monooxygenase SsuD/methylene tetrahydromethanopterin reductase-like flavin-dependent oxidoreductase (luciferase family)
MLAALAASTGRVRLGPLVACLGFHAPGILARTAAAVDEISGGRLVLGVGAGWNLAEFRAFGLPFERRVDRFEEAFGIVRRLLSGERVTSHGRFWSVEDAVLFPTPARRPPLMIGSTGERMLGIALPHVDAWNTWYREIDNTVEGFEAASAAVTAAARRAGRDPAAIERSVCVLVLVDRAATERPIDVEPVAPEGLVDRLRALAEAGASEAIVVASPITEASIRSLATALTRLDR